MTDGRFAGSIGSARADEAVRMRALARAILSGAGGDDAVLLIRAAA